MGLTVSLASVCPAPDKEHFSEAERDFFPLFQCAAPAAIFSPQSFSGGGLYSSGNRLLLIDYDWLLIMVCVVTVTFFDSYCNDGVSAGIWVIHSGPKSGGELVTPFGS